MDSNVTELSKALTSTFLGGLMEGCVIKVEDKKAGISCMNKSASVFVQTFADLNVEDCAFGIGKLALFVKYINSIKDRPVSLKHVDNKMVFKPSVGSVLRYALTEVDFIPTYDEEWGYDLVEQELKNFEGVLPLKSDLISELVKSTAMFEPNSLSFKVDKKGNVVASGGVESDHNFELPLGKAKGMKECSVEVLSKNILAVFSCLEYEVEPEMYLSEEDGIIITNGSTSWILQPIADSGHLEDEYSGEGL